MSNTITKTVTEHDKHQWDTLADHPLQSWAWGEFRKTMGLSVERIGIYTKDKLVAAWQLTFHPVPHTPFTIGYFPKGPAPTAFMLEALKKIGKKHQTLFIQLEPNTLLSEDSAPSSEHLDLVPSHHPLFTKYTFSLDLKQSEEELLKHMHPKTRYNIKVAQKHGVTIVEDNSPKAFATYLALSEETTKRQGFYAHNRTYQQTMWDTLSKANIAHLWNAVYKGTVLASWILFYWGKTIYYPYGASSRNYREVMAPNLLLWEIAKYGKSQGYTTFDLWGALGPNPDIHDPWYGFHRFKQGYSPQLLAFVGSYDLVINSFLYQFYKIADTIRWQILRSRK